jgi:hypothetical protein
MFAFLDKLLPAGPGSPTRRQRPLGLESLWGDRPLGRAASQPVGVRPELEHLEERAVPSATSISAVTDLNHNQVVYVVGDANHIWSHDKDGWHYIGGVALPSNPVVSASVSPSGSAEVFTIGTDHALWKYDGSWHYCGGYCTQISANCRDVCGALGWDSHSPFRWDSTNGWIYLGGWADDISTGEDFAGAGMQDVLWATTSAHDLWVNDGSWRMIGSPLQESGPNTGKPRGATSPQATMDGHVFFVSTDGDNAVYEYHHGDGHNVFLRTYGGILGPIATGAYVYRESTGKLCNSWGAYVEGRLAGGQESVFVYCPMLSPGWKSVGNQAARLAGNQFAGKGYNDTYYDTAGTQNNVFYIIAKDGTVWANDNYGWHGYGGLAVH